MLTKDQQAYEAAFQDGVRLETSGKTGQPIQQYFNVWPSVSEHDARQPRGQGGPQ